MEFELYVASNCECKSTIDVNTLDDLKDLSESNGRVKLIINFHDAPMYNGPASITLYDWLTWNKGEG